MSYKAFFKKRNPSGSTRKVVMNFGGGQNEYLPPISIEDNQISAGLDYWSRDGLSLKRRDWIPDPYVYSPTAEIYTFSGSTAGGMVTWSGTISGMYPLLADRATPFYATVIDGPVTDYSVASYNFIAKPETTGVVEYFTEVDRYSVYWSTDMNILLVQAHSSRALSTVTLPTGVYPRDAVHHANRIFLLDTKNKIWWSKAGDYTTWHGGATTETYVTDDAGYFTVESTESVNRIMTFRDVLYIFGDNSIYVLEGYSYPTFAVRRLISGFGTYAYSYRSLCCRGKSIFFTYKCRVYEWDGTASEPYVISEPIVSGGKYVNNISSGVKPWNETYYTQSSVLSLYADEKWLYWYPFYNVYHADMASGNDRNIYQRIGMFDLERRCWWKSGGFSKTFNFLPTDKTAGSHFYMFPAREATESSWGIAVHWSGSASTVAYNQAWAGLPGIGGYPTFMTKAFSAAPSEGMVLTDIYLFVRSTTGYVDGINPDYTLDMLDVKIVEATLDWDYDGTMDNLWMQEALVYDNTAPYPDISTLKTTNKFSVMHIPIRAGSSLKYDDQYDPTFSPEDVASTWGNGFFTSYGYDTDAGFTLIPSPIIKLEIYWHGDPNFELHRMELKYRVKGTPE